MEEEKWLLYDFYERPINKVFSSESEAYAYASGLSGTYEACQLIPEEEE